jgi:microcompartment protein CcmL/EutN
MDVFSIAVGAIAVGVIYFLYLAATRGLPAAIAWARAKWSAGKADLVGLQGDVAGLGGKVTALEQGAVADLQRGFEALRGDIDALKARVPVTAAAPAAAPSFIAAPAQAAPHA